MAGGINAGIECLSSVELFDPATNTFSYIGNHYVPSMTTIRHSHAATLLASGKALLLGGYGAVWTAQSTAEWYDPSAQTFSFDGSMNEMRADPAIVRLASGQVLVVGGYRDYYTVGALNTAELYQPGTQATSSTVLTASPNPSIYGSAVTFTATVTPSTATGTVTFYNYIYPQATVNLSGGQATWVTSTLVPAGQGITAWYHGDVNYQSSTSSMLLQTINPTPSSTSVSSSSNPSIQGNSVTFTATVTPSLCTGTVTFYDGITSLGPPVNLSGGTAMFSTSMLSVGSHSITASYSGNGSCQSSTSSPLTQVVNPIVAPTLVSLAVSPANFSVAAGNTTAFTATGTYSDDSTQDVTAMATWDTSAPDLAQIDATGLVTAIDDGQVVIQATMGGISASATLTVTPGQLDAVITPTYQPGTLHSGFGYPNQKAIAVGVDGFSRFLTGDSSSSGDSDEVVYIRCLDADCVTFHTKTFSTGNLTASYSMALGPDGYPRIAYSTSYRDPNTKSSFALHFIQCSDDDCAGSIDTFVDEASDNGVAGIAVGSDGTSYLVYDYGFDFVGDDGSEYNQGVALATCSGGG